MTIKMNDLISAGALVALAGICIWAIKDAVKESKKAAEIEEKYKKEVKPLLETADKKLEESIDEASMNNNYIPDPEEKVKARLILASYKTPILKAKTIDDYENAKVAFKIVHNHLMQSDAETWVAYYYTVYKQEIEKEQLKAERDFKERQIDLNAKSLEGVIKAIGSWILPEIRKIVRGGW